MTHFYPLNEREIKFKKVFVPTGQKMWRFLYVEPHICWLDCLTIQWFGWIEHFGLDLWRCAEPFFLDDQPMANVLRANARSLVCPHLVFVVDIVFKVQLIWKWWEAKISYPWQLYETALKFWSMTQFPAPQFQSYLSAASSQYSSLLSFCRRIGYQASW